eukprot:3235573-Pleurochrysis_carterae.AAC.1
MLAKWSGNCSTQIKAPCSCAVIVPLLGGQLYALLRRLLVMVRVRISSHQSYLHRLPLPRHIFPVANNENLERAPQELLRTT